MVRVRTNGGKGSVHSKTLRRFLKPDGRISEGSAADPQLARHLLKHESTMTSKTLILLAALALPTTSQASTAYGSLNNFDVVNDTGGKCYGFEIELEDIRSVDVTYTYDYNHYGTPRITEDNSIAGHPRVSVRYESKKNPDGSWASFTNPQDPLNPLAPTDGHAFTNPSLNLGGEHFGMGYYGSPSVVRYHWLVEDVNSPGTLIHGPAVQVATPQFTYVAPANPGQPPVIRAVIVPQREEQENEARFGVPVWVKILKTIQPSGRKVRLEDLVTDDPQKEGDKDWAGDEAPETEIEWMVFQKHPAGEEEGEDIQGDDALKDGNEIVTRRYEFYVYNGPINPKDGEAKCSKPERCPDSVGAYIGAQMAGFGADMGLGLIQNLQSGAVNEPYVERSVAAGGKTPYTVRTKLGTLPPGMTLDPVTGVLAGTPTEAGQFALTLEVIDAAGTTKSQAYQLTIEAEKPLSAELSISLENAELVLWLRGTPNSSWQLQMAADPAGPWENVEQVVALPAAGALEFRGTFAAPAAYYRAIHVE